MNSEHTGLSMRTFFSLSFSLLIAGCASAPPEPAAPVPVSAPEKPTVTRSLILDYTVTLSPSDQTRDLWLPIPTSDDAQRVISASVSSTVDGRYGTDKVYGDRFWHGTFAASTQPQTVVLSAKVERLEQHLDLSAASTAPLSPEELKEHALYLSGQKRVPVGSDQPVLAPLLAEIPVVTGGLQTARGLFDWVVDNMEYKKVGTGWGNGDAFWACNSRYGNCTDFHSVFLSLARTRGVPARFDIGFPIPDRQSEGELKGYHCWVNFWVKGVGWVPADASEAAKHPQQKADYFGAGRSDRIRMSTGRDLVLGQAGEPLNYFVFPYVESQGAPTQDAQLSVHFREVPEGFAQE